MNINKISTQNFGVKLTGARNALAKQITKAMREETPEQKGMVYACYSIIKYGLPDKELQVNNLLNFVPEITNTFGSEPIEDSILDDQLQISDKSGEILSAPITLAHYRNGISYTYTKFIDEFKKVAEKVASLHLGKKVTINNAEDAKQIDRQVLMNA